MKENISKNKVWQIVGVSVLCAVLVLGVVLGVVFGMNHSSEDLNVSKDMSEQDGLVISQEVSKGITLLSGVATTAADGTTTKQSQQRLNLPERTYTIRFLGKLLSKIRLQRGQPARTFPIT